MENQTLTDSERSLLAMVAAGHSNKEIAHKLEVQNGTVKSRLHRVFRKLGARNRVEATLSYLSMQGNSLMLVPRDFVERVRAGVPAVEEEAAQLLASQDTADGGPQHSGSEHSGPEHGGPEQQHAA